MQGAAGDVLGLPVKVRYSQRGDTLFADEVVIVTAPGTPEVPAPTKRTQDPTPGQ